MDGNDIQQLVAVLKEIKKLDGPKLLHIVTTKGKGFEQAEKEQTIFHAPGPFDRETGALLSKSPGNRVSYQEVYGKTLLELAKKDEKVVAVTPAMPSGSALNYMAEEFPDRVFDVGIAEQHAVTFSAGLASEGFIPFCTIYSTFFQRAYDQVIHDVALQNLPVIFGIDRAGLVGGDGATHHGVFDMAYLNSVPNMVVAAPMDELELRNMMFTAHSYRKGPFAIRYPRGYGFVGADSWHQDFEKIQVGKGRMLKDGKDVAIITLGQPGNFALEACRQMEEEGIDAALYDLRFLKPLDESLLQDIFRKFKNIITIEDGVIRNGMGSTVAALVALSGANIKLINLGIPDYFVEQGSKDSLYRECGMDVEGIKKAVKRLLGS